MPDRFDPVNGVSTRLFFARSRQKTFCHRGDAVCYILGFSMSDQNMKQKESVNDEELKRDSAAEEPVVETAGTGADAEAGSGEESPADPVAALEAAREEGRRHYERFLRLTADFENYRRRMLREKEELRQFAMTSFVEEFLPVLDNIALGLQTAENHPEAAGVTAGFRMVAEQIRGILSRQGVEEVDPAGQPFDPHRHESVVSQPDPDIPEGHVIHVVRRGYLLNGRLIRPATVVVSSGPPDQNQAQNPAE